MSIAFRIGVLVFLGLACLAVGIFLIGNKDLLFTQTYQLNAQFQNVGGLNNGSEVRIDGMHQGTIKQIQLPTETDGKVNVVMTLDKTTLPLIKKDSKASIQTEGLLGDKYIEIAAGSAKAPSVGNNDTIVGEQPPDMAAEAHQLADQASQGLTAFRDDAQALQSNFLLKGFFEKRGYNDTSQLTDHAVSHLPKGKPVKEFDYDPGDLFDKPDNAKLKNKNKLDEPGKYLEQNPFGMVVVASSEAKGDTDQDHVLSEARAKVVRDYLVQNFKVDDKHIETFGLGKTKDPNQPSGVAILIYAGKSAPAPITTAKAQPAKP